MEMREAHRLVRSAVLEGRLLREPCEVCRDPLAEAHHDDYDAPLAVRWLCRKHHQAWHRENSAVNGGVEAKVVSTRLPAGYALLLAEQAEELGMKPSELLRRIVAEWFDKGGPLPAKPTRRVQAVVEEVVAERDAELGLCRHGLNQCKTCHTGRWALPTNGGL